MDHDPQHRDRTRREEALRGVERTRRQMRWVVRGVLALAVILAVAWLLLVRR